METPKIDDYVRCHGVLIAVHEFTPPPPPPVKVFVFEEQEARCELRLNGNLLKELQTLDDFYGLGTAVKTAVSEMTEYARREGIDADSALEVVVVKTQNQLKTQALDKENFYDKQYCDFDHTSIFPELLLAEMIETVVWSSKNEPSNPNPTE